MKISPLSSAPRTGETVLLGESIRVLGTDVAHIYQARWRKFLFWGWWQCDHYLATPMFWVVDDKTKPGVYYLERE